MIFGLLAGELVRSERSGMSKLAALVMAGAVCLLVGTVLDVTVCPIVKRIWTPSWTIYSTGWALWQLAFFYGRGRRGGLSPLGLPAGRRRRQLDRHVRDVAALEAVRRQHAADPPGHVLDSAGHTPAVDRLVYERHRHAPRPPPLRAASTAPFFQSSAVLFRLLAGLPLDVPAADLREDLIGRCGFWRAPSSPA